jgi:hypothetical protein
MLAITSVEFAGTQTLAVSAPPPPTKHQIMVKTVDCMRKRMSIDRVVSYNEAAKTCRDQIRKQRGQPAPAALATAGDPPKT